MGSEALPFRNGANWGEAGGQRNSAFRSRSPSTPSIGFPLACSANTGPLIAEPVLAPLTITDGLNFKKTEEELDKFFHTPHAFVDQPPRHFAKIRGKAPEASHRLRVAVWADRHPMLAAANITSSIMWRQVT